MVFFVVPDLLNAPGKVAVHGRRHFRYGICKFILFIVTTMLPSSGTTVLSADEMVETPLSIGQITGCVSENGLIRLPQEHVQHDPNQIVMEAEEATTLSFDDKIFSDAEGLRGTDPEASNGRFVCYINDARYRFKVTTPGKYVVWLRAWAPWTGQWCHTETMDDHGLTLDNDYRLKPELLVALRKKGGGPRSLLDLVVQPNDARLKIWIWIKPTIGQSQQPSIYELSAGTHELKVDYQGGIRLDKIVLTRDMNFTPEGKGPAAPAGRGVHAGALITDDVQPKAVKRWRELHGVMDAAGGQVAMSYSTDGGENWTPFADPTAIGSLPVQGDGKDRIRFRFDLVRSPQHASPVLQRLALAYVSAVKREPLPPISTLPETIRDVSGRTVLVADDRTGFACAADGYALPDHVWRMEPGKPLVFEAENYSEACFYPNAMNGLREEAGASGSKVIYQFPHFRNQLRYDFSLPTGGKYRIWYRIRFDQIGQWSSVHLASMDNSGMTGQHVALPVGYIPARGWVVVPGPVYLLASGLHSFYLHGHFDYAHLDQILVLPEGRKPSEMGLKGDGPFPVSAAVPYGFAVMRMSPVQPACVKAWKTIGYDAELNGGEVKIKVSADGQNWRPVKELANLPVRGNGSDVLYVRIALQRAAGNPSPKLKRAWVNYDTGGIPELVLKNSTMEMRFSPDGHMMGIRDVKNDRWILPQAAHGRLFELKTRSPGESSLRAYQHGEGPTLIDRRYERKGDRQQLVFTYGLFDNALKMTCKVALDGSSLATWEMKIANESQAEVREYTFPQFRGIRLGTNELDDLAAWCTTIGGLYPSPGAGGINWIDSMRYPGDAGMPWVDFSDPSGGLYLCSQDPTLTATDITYASGANRGTWDLKFTKHSYVPARKTAQFGYQVGVHSGDWHWAADTYHRWFYSWNKKPEHPDWAVNNPGWWSMHGSEYLYSRLATHWWPKAEWLGFRHCQRWGTTADGESCGFWNHYNPKFGSREELIAANAALKKVNAHFGGYLNIQGWTEDYLLNPEFVGCTPKKFFEKGFEKLLPPLGWRKQTTNMFLSGALMQGGPGLASIPSAKQAYMCVGDSSKGGWHEHLKKWCADVNSGEYGCDTVYLDQTSCTPPALCYNDKHGHGKDHGANGRLLTQLLREMNMQGLKANPNFAIGVEGMVDVHSLWTGFNLYVGSEQNKGELFLYTHPWAAYYRGNSNGGGFDPIPTNHKICLLFLYSRYDMGGDESELLRAAVAIRQRTGDFFYQGRFHDDVRLTVDKPDILLKWFERQDDTHSGALVNICNFNRVAGAKATLTTKSLGKVTHAIVYTADHKVEITPVIRRGDSIRFPIPSTPISAALLIDKAFLGEVLRVYAARPVTAGPDRLEVYLINTTAKPIEAQASIAAIPAVILSQERFTEMVPAHSVVVRTIQVSDLAKRSVRSTARVRVSWNGQNTTTTALLAPPVINGDFETDSNGDGYADAWGTYSPGFFHSLVQWAVDAPAPTKGCDGELDGKIKHSGKTSLKLRGRMTFTHRDMAGTALADNPGFLAAGHRPLFWDPNVAQSLVLKANTVYRLTLWLRTSAKPGRDVTVMVQDPGGGKPLASLNLKDDTSCVNQWNTYSLILRPTVHGGVHHLTVTNTSDQTLWGDGVQIDEIRALVPTVQADAMANVPVTPIQPRPAKASAAPSKPATAAPVAAHRDVPENGVPDFFQSPDKAVGVLMGDKIEAVQINPLMKSCEGTLVKGSAKGKTGWSVAPTPKDQDGRGGRMMYFQCFEKPEDFRIWKGQDNVKMAVEFYDGTPGNLTFCYDAMNMVWRTLPPAATGLSIDGRGRWRTAIFDLPEPAFQRRCNGYDFRINLAYLGAEREPFLIRRITMFKVPEQW